MQIQATLRRHQISLLMENLRFIVRNIHCASCISTIEKSLQRLQASKKNKLQDFKINFVDKSLSVQGKIAAKEIIENLKVSGYQAELVRDDDAMQKQKEQEKTEYRYFLTRSLLALFYGGSLMIYGLSGGSMQVVTASDKLLYSLVAALSLFIMFYSGAHFYRGAFQKIKHLQTNMDSLIALSTAIAWCYSSLILFLPELFPIGARHFYFEASAMIIGLVNFGYALEIKTKQKTYRVLESLFQLKAKTAKLVDKKSRQDQDVAIDKIKKGDWIRVLSGEKVPLDAEVLEGAGNVDESALTGEFILVFKTKGSQVIGGSTNLEGSFIAKVTNILDKSLLSQIIAIVKKAQSSKSPMARMADTIASVFVPIILVVAVLTAIAWYFLAPIPQLPLMFITSTSVLIIACPCALGLATPLSVMVGINRAAKSGILIHSAAALQKLTHATSLILDKTGTITEGKPQVVEFQNFSKMKQQKIFELVLALEQGTKHPFAVALIGFVQEQLANQNKFSQIQNFKTIVGSGVCGEIAGEEFFLGNAKWLKNLGFTLDHVLKKTRVCSYIFLATSKNKEVLACFFIADEIRKNAFLAIKKLKKMGIKIFIASGDNQKNVDFVARECSITTAFGELSPQDKAQKVAKLQAQGEVVVFVGDGTNDAPALATADVGMAMSSGTDLAIESASLVLMSHSLAKIIHSIEISRQTVCNIKQNLFFAFAYNIICIPIAAGVLYPVLGILLSPIFAALAMSLSSLTLVLNSVRLYFYKLA